jgi:hypothetical protein
MELPGSRGRITVYCTCENLEMKKLAASFKAHFPYSFLNNHQEAMHG